MAYLEGALDTLQHELVVRFATLRDARAGAPVYALEHGLDAERLLQVRESVGAAARRVGIGASWREHPLPLLVVATEVGYGYRGTGTDFWPALCGALAAELSFTEHMQLSDLFAAAHQRLGLKKPADTPWNRLFRHIAWPISNAIAPVEIHRGLAQALYRVFQQRPPSLEGADLGGALQAAARAVGSPRLEEWVTDQGLSVALARRLMRLDHEGAISPEAIERIWRDLSADTIARRAMRQAMREQRRPARARRAAASATGRARLQLVTAESGDPQLVISASFPDTSDAQRRVLRGLSLAPWPGAEPIGLEAFLLGHPQLLTLSELPEAGQAFLSGLTDFVADGDLCDRLAGAAPDMTLPLVFAGTAEVAHQARDRSLSGSEEVWLIVKDAGAAPAGIAVVGRVGPGVCLHVPEPSKVADWLVREGVAVPDLDYIEPVDAVVVGQTPRGPVIGAGLPGLFRLNGSRDPAIVSADMAPGVTLSAETPYLLAIAGAGDHELTVSLRGRSSLLTWMSGTSDRDPEDSLEIALDPAAPSIEMFRRGEVAVHIRTALRPGPTPMGISVVIGERVVAKSRAFGVRLPTILTAGDAMIRELLQELDSTELPRTGDVWIVVDIEGLCREWWPLSREIRRVAWARHDRQWKPRLDGQVLDIGVIDADQPLQEMRAEAGEDVEAIRLLMPVAAEGPLDEAGLVVGPRRLNIVASPALAGRLGRAWRSAGGLAAHDVCLSYLRWSWAVARNPVLEVGRRKVVAALEAAAVVQLCGETWSQIEGRYALAVPDSWTALAETSIARGLATGDDQRGLDGWKQSAFTRYLAQRMALTVPRLWLVGEVSDEVAGQLDLAVDEAWGDLFQEILQRESRLVLEDVDPFNSATEWSEAVRAASDRMRFASLLDFVLPSARAQRLGEADYQDLSLDEVGEILIGDHTDLSPRGQPRWLNDEDIRRALLFWVRPAALSADPDWASTLKRLLSDRPTARAVRYAALRYSASRGRGR